ncbi:nitroreductase family protein [Plantactinospora sp. WMMC1484]|uniref:nitroreductase family protein n=1 Tax=Plantactinospora sp. WMMC1484 TaxID=3404122 RepID=UPI003BF5A544
MEFSAVVRRRRMVRNYDPERPVPPELVDRLLEHAVRAPSAGFSQGWAFLVLTEPTDRELFWTATAPARPEVLGRGPSTTENDKRGPFLTRWLAGMRRAPLIVVPLADRSAYLERYAEPDKGWVEHDERRWPVPYWFVDTGFAALLMLLTAVDEGLGACFFGIPGERVGSFREAFGVPGSFTPIGAVSVGYPAPDHRPSSLRRGRRPMTQVVHRGRWG